MRQYPDITNSFTRKIASALLLLLVIGTNANAQQEFDGLRGTHKWMRFSDAPNALYHHIAGEAVTLLDKRAQEVSALNTLAEWKERQALIRSAFMDVVGPFPERTPLNPHINAVIKKDGYTVENIVYESQPGFYVTSALFVPDGLRKKDKAPAIIYCSGHSESGYRSRVYQHVIINLVKKGFIVFAIDPIGQGERLGYYDEKKGRSTLQWPTSEHSYPGAQLFLTGTSLARYMIWDGIRAVDYLISRSEVDPERIGITGRSGGGTQSAYIAAFDDRIRAVAPENYITNLSMMFDSIGPQDAEQNFFRGVLRGLDMADLLLVRAPLPAMMITTSRDMFPIQGSIETAEEVSRLYQTYGRPGNFSMVTDDAPHASTKKNRESLYAFFQKQLGNPGDSSDMEVKTLSDTELQVTKTGQVSTSLESASVFSLNLREATKLNNTLQEARINDSEHFTKAADAAKERSGYRDPEEPQSPVFTGRIQRNGYTIEKFFIKGEGEYVIPYLLMEPEEPGDKALIYLHPDGKAADSDEGGEMEWFVRNGFTVLAPDLLGTGEMGPGQLKGDSYIDSVSYNLWFASLLIGRSITGIQAGDVVKLVHLLGEIAGVKEIYGLAKREFAPVLLHAAAFENAIAHVALIEPYASYRSLVMTRDYNPEFIQSAVPASVGVYDLPDLAASLAPGKLLIVGVTDATGKNRDTEIVEGDMAVIEHAYQKRHASDRLRIVPDKAASALYDTYTAWINGIEYRGQQ